MKWAYIYVPNLDQFMSRSDLQIRSLFPRDNQALKTLIQEVLIEHDVPKVGTAFADPELDDLYTAYQQPRSCYFVITDGKTLFGGGGIAPLKNFDGNYCELQKMYFSSNIRGKGFGKKLMQKCLAIARYDFAFEACYIETMHNMRAAQLLYEKFGFQRIQGALGNTGHHNCPVQMLLQWKQ